MKVIFILYVVLFSTHYLFKSSIIRTILLALLCCLYVLLCIHFEVSPQWWNSLLCFPFGYFLAFLDISSIYENIKAQNNKCFILWGGVLVLFIFTYFLSKISLPHTGILFKQMALVLSSLLFSIFAILVVSRININCVITTYVGRNSLCIYLFHLFFLQFSDVCNIYVYLLIMVCGTIGLTSLFSFLFSKR